MEEYNMFIYNFYNQLLIGNGSVITTENIGNLNNLAIQIYNKDELNTDEIDVLKHIIMSCNILYNRTDMTVLPIEDGFYDLLLEKYKKYDEHFQVGSAVVEFRNFVESDIISKGSTMPTCPIMFEEAIERSEIREDMRRQIMRVGQPILNRHDFACSPISFDSGYIRKATHDTEHNHPSLVGTLDKCKFVFNQDAIIAGVFEDSNVTVLERDFFQDHVKKGIIHHDQEIGIICELKYDGISVEADCNLEVVSARTRGDTGVGKASDITPILAGYPFKQARCMIGEKPIGVKFEAIMTKTNLALFNKLRERNYSNCRTAIVGLFGASDAYLYRDLITLIPLAVDRDDIPMISNRIEEIEFLNRVFVSHGEPLRYCYFRGRLNEIMYMIKAFWDEAKIARNHLDFMFDGIVLSYADEDIRERLGRQNYINKYSVAVKFDADEKQTIFRGYSYEVGQHGQITPMIHYDPVEFIGTIHTKSTGSSYERFMKLGLRKGDIINVTYVNDVMPYVSKLDCEHNRRNAEITPLEEFVQVCPICGSHLVQSESGKTVSCSNMECPARSIQRMSNMLAKLNIKGFSDASIIALKVNYLHELLHMSNESIIEALGVANGEKLIIALNNMRMNPTKDYLIMGSLGFTSIARKKWETILQFISIENLYKVYKKLNNYHQFRDAIAEIIPAIGAKTADTIARELPFFENDILAILEQFNIEESYGIVKEAKLQIRFSGVRNKHLSQLLCNAGYDADDSLGVTKATDILLVPFEGYSSSKTKKVPKGCITLVIDDFIENISKYIQDEEVLKGMQRIRYNG